MRHKARIGAHVAPADSDSRKLFSLSAEVRWVVEDVFPDSPAQATGLRRGEGLLKAEGHVPNPFLSYNPSCCRQLGEKMDDRIQREGRSVPLEVAVAARPIGHGSLIATPCGSTADARFNPRATLAW